METTENTATGRLPWNKGKSCETDLGEQPVPEPPSQFDAFIHPAVRADCGFMGLPAGIGQGKLRNAHPQQANEGYLDFPPNEDPASRSAAARTHEAGKYRALPRHRSQ